MDVKIRFHRKEIWDDLKVHIIEKYGTDYGHTGFEVEEAIKYHLAREGYGKYPEIIKNNNIKYEFEKNPTHSHKISKKDQEIIEKIKHHYQDGTEISFVHLRKLINQCGLKDIRTHRNHIDTLVAFGFLSLVDPIEEYDLYIFNSEPPPP